MIGIEFIPTFIAVFYIVGSLYILWLVFVAVATLIGLIFDA